jgi:hypothetical protein
MKLSVQRMCRFAVVAGIGMLTLQMCAGQTSVGQQLENDRFASEEIEFFEKRVRPIFVEHCYECHSVRAKKLQAGLLLDSRESILKGGDSGPAIVAGAPKDSLLIDAVHHDGFEMPPDGKLTKRTITDLETWVRIGAPWPADRSSRVEPDNTKQHGIDLESGRRFWSFRPVSKVTPPSVSNLEWPRKKIDYFILSTLEEKGMQPSPSADKRTLIRRLYYDLVGLPPTFSEVEAFAREESADAYQSLVERLLASPQYGEQWARYWLDLVRYGEDNPNGELAPRYAYRYRDWIVDALNRDLPYDEFVRRQLAADFLDNLPPPELAALGFLGLSPSYFKGPKQSKQVLATVLADEWEERIDVVSRTLLGLTVACARCHDHKFDPISTADYYALAGVIANTQLVEQPIDDIFDEDASYVADLTEALRYHKQRYEQRFKQREGLKKEKAPDIYRYDKEILESASEIQRITSLLPQDYDRIRRVNAVRDAAATIDDQAFVVRELVSPEARFWTTVRYEPNRVRNLPIHVRGDASQFGSVVPRRFIEVLSARATPFRVGSGRLELAEAILGDAAALSGRVIVNRIWGWHFGQPLVRTPSNFGALGDRPSHPTLLDDLTSRFVSGGWSLKNLHREIVMSATYRQSSEFNAEYQSLDPENSLLWRMNRRRLNVELWRDAALSVSGSLATELGGPPGDLDDAGMHRRTLYGKVSRKRLASLLRLFDYPEPTRHSPQRNVTTTPLQQLYFMNSPFMHARSIAVIQNLPDSREIEVPSIRAVFRQVLARDPSAGEIAIARELLSHDSGLEVRDRWNMLAQALLVSNEFLFVD